MRNQGAGSVTIKYVETVVLDENGYPVKVACPGNLVTVIVAVENTG